MRKYLSLFLLLFLFLGNLAAQESVFKTQGFPRPDITVGQSKATVSASKSSLLRNAEDFTFDDIRFWVGEGDNRCALAVQWNTNAGETNAMVWGYQWDGDEAQYGVDLLYAVAKADPRFCVLAEATTSGYGTAIAGIGYDANDDGVFFVRKISTGDLYYPDENGVIAEASGYNYDDFESGDPEDYWGAGWYNSYWSYWLKGNDNEDWGYSGLGASSKLLTDGCWDGWNFAYGMSSYSWKPFIAALPPPMALNHTSTTIYVNDDLQLTPIIYLESYQGQSITWTSNDDAIATVDQNGNITAVAVGSATITAKIADDCYAECVVTVEIKPEIVSLDFEDVIYWVGEGEKQAGVAIKWNDGKEEDALTWGYRWDGDKKVIDMLKDIAREDERFFILLNENNSVVIGGIGFDLNDENTTAIIYNNLTTYPQYPVEGLITTITSDYDKYTVRDEGDHWSAGVSEKGIWNYLVMEEGGSSFTVSSEPILERELTDGSWNAWNFDANFEDATLGVEFNPVPEYVSEVVDYTKGIFFVNEDWFGHTNGSVNFLKEDGEWIYRAYTRENPKQAFGSTTQFGTIYGDNFYFVSKQAADAGDTQYTPGGRLVIADAKTLKNKANFDVLSTIGDGRSFLGVDEHTGYIGGSGGIALFNIDDLTIGDVIDGTGGGSLYSGQIGTMLRVGDYVFACKQSKGILVIDAKTHTVIQTIECKNIGTIVQSKNGYLWASAYADGLWKINPYTLEIEQKIAIPTAAQIPGSWGAWTSSLMVAGESDNTLYWAKMNGSSSMTFFGTKVFKYDIDNDDVEDASFLSTPFYELSGYDGQEGFYGSGLNVNPVTDDVVITTTRSGYGANYQNNRVHIIDGQTAAVKNIYDLNDYYWFPAMSVFPDVHAPVVSGLLANITIDGETKISLGDKVSDSDNRNAAIIKSIVSVSDESLFTSAIVNDELVLTPISGRYGSADVEIKFNSNGQVTTKTITVSIEAPAIDATGVTLDETSKTLEVSETLQLTATVVPDNTTNKNVTWASSNTAVATVNADGLVTAVTAGDATITVTTIGEAYSASCQISVSGATTGINDVIDNSLSIYIEPVSGAIIINSPVDGIAGIYSISGNMVINSNITIGENRIETYSLDKGIYIVRFANKSLKFTKK